MEFENDHGVIVACDVPYLDDLEELVEQTHGVEGVSGYKVGKSLGLRYGLPEVVDTVRNHTDKAVIYDHQKAGTDVPFIDGEQFPEIMDEAGVDAAIIFPQAGPVTEEAAVNGLLERGVKPIVGGDMTHDGYRENEGGYIREDAPAEMYRNGAESGAETFVVPGNRHDAITEWTEIISEVAQEPRLMAPGFGRQGGDVTSGIEAAKEANEDVGFHTIIGSGIYKQPVPEDAGYQSFENPGDAAQNYAGEALRFE